MTKLRFTRRRRTECFTGSNCARAVALEPAHRNGYWGLGILSCAQGALDQAVLHYRDALQREARRPFIWSELAYLYIDLGASGLAEEALSHTAKLLPASPWPALLAAYAWLVRPDRGEPPAALALTPQNVPEDLYAVDLMLVRAIAGLPLDERLLQRALDVVHCRDTSLEPMLWLVFLGFHPMIDLAAVYAALGLPDKGKPYLEGRTSSSVGMWWRQGNVWHALAFHSARLLALQGQTEPALDSLTRPSRPAADGDGVCASIQRSPHCVNLHGSRQR